MQVETLESRTLFSVTVTEGYPGVFEITGDGDDDSIVISVSQNEYTFTLDDVTYYSVTYLSINGAGGADNISVTSTDGPGFIGASIVGGDDDDSISIGIDGAIWGGNGNDSITLADSYRGGAYGEDGNDTITVSGASVDAEIQGGSGDDLIDCAASTVDIVAQGGYGNDTLIGSDCADQLYGDEGSDLLVGGGGNDEFYASEGDTIIGDAGYDFLYTGGASGMIHDCECAS